MQLVHFSDKILSQNESKIISQHWLMEAFVSARIIVSVVVPNECLLTEHKIVERPLDDQQEFFFQ